MPRNSTSPSPPSDLDEGLLSGFSFECRPDCGLCCFASPRLEGTDEERLQRVVPPVRVVTEEGERRVASRPDGGACELLENLRCRAHAARPAPCREFPVSVHVGTRVQATLVLSCPGLSLGPLDRFGEGAQGPPPVGLDTELDSVRDRLAPVGERMRAESVRRQRRVARRLTEEGRWADDEDVRRELAAGPLAPSVDDYSPDELPAAEDGLEPLPMFFDRRTGPVALAQATSGWEALEMFTEGGTRSVGIAVPPEQLPSLTEEASRLLEGYLRYFLARDAFLAAVHLDMQRVSEGTVVESAREELHAIGSDVLARAAVRAQLAGDSGARLTRSDVERGIRATDQDWLDRPTWGRRL